MDIRDKAIEFLGQGYSPEFVAQTVGVTPARISQMLAEEEFRSAVRNRRIANLQKQTSLDTKYEDIEEKLQTKLEKSLPLLSRPRDILDAIRTINGTKRRGQSPTETMAEAKVVQISMPTKILQQFISVEKDSTNRIIGASINGEEQGLITVQSTELIKESEKQKQAALVTKELSHDSQRIGSLPGQSTRGIPGKTTEICASDLD